MSFLARSLAAVVLAAALSTGVALLPVAPFGAHPAWPHGGGGGGSGIAIGSAPAAPMSATIFPDFARQAAALQTKP
jgi:1-acyl-sn-glycerol-3-phosphate acyltransferase